MRTMSIRVPVALLALGLMPAAHAQLLITEVIPGVSTTTTSGDTVEIYNNGVAADLTDLILSDLDPTAAETSLLNEATFAPASLGLPLLQTEEFAVVVFCDSTGGTPFSYIQTNYGLQIFAPLVSSGSPAASAKTTCSVATSR